MTRNDQTEILTVREIFERGPYVVPIYQRAYAWGTDQIQTLLQDVRDYRQRRHEQYFIGSLVTYVRTNPDGEDLFEVVDGQQRLTTLFIALSVLAQEAAEIGARRASGEILRFEGRKRSAEDLGRLARWMPDSSVDDLREFGIKVAAETIRSAWDSGTFDADDLRYLVDNVRIVRTTLPRGTDLNHYFEVMNSRGEQLEKHEIVKAYLMGILASSGATPEASRTFARIWDACSDMSRHVQRAFNTTERTKLFDDDWDSPTFTTFDEVVTAISDDASQADSGSRRLGTVLSSSLPVPGAVSTDESDETERYGAIIDFPNFLLQVLAVRAGGPAFDWISAAPVTLDDKQLVAAFKAQLTDEPAVTEFAHSLLRLRHLFDRYVIKTDRSRESDDDSNWVLVRARRLVSRTSSPKLSPIATFGPDTGDEGATQNSEHSHVVLLQSMFQVTDSRRSYKNFLYAILCFLDTETSGVTANSYAAFLQDLAARRNATLADVNLDDGTSVPHFVFNYLDYLIWSGARETHRAYRFRYRTSVEHFYPQHPEEDGRIEKLPKGIVDRFGNLCLMSRSENSKRSNLAPEAKIGQYRSDTQSLKFQLMAEVARTGWAVTQIEEQSIAMRAVLGPLTAPGTGPPTV